MSEQKPSSYLVTAWGEYYTHVDASSPDKALRAAKQNSTEWHRTVNKPFEFYEVESGRPMAPPPLSKAIDRLWVVITPSHEMLSEMWTDPAYTDDEVRLAHFCGALAEPDGYDIDTFVRVYWGGSGHLTWDQEESKLYHDEAPARRDAVSRFEKAKRLYGPKA